MLDTIKRYYWRALAVRNRKNVSLTLSPHDPMDAIARFLAGKKRVVMVDGGAHDGRMALRFRDRIAGIEVHAFEPNADLFPRLQTHLTSVPGTRNQLALAAVSRSIEFIVNDSPMTSSVLARAEPSTRYFDAATRPRETRRLEATSLDDWCGAHDVDRIDLLKLDLQGYELEALRGATRMLRRGISCIYAEVNFIPFYEGSALFSDLDALLRPLGYRLHNLYNLCTHLPEGQIGSGDALWVFADTAAASMKRRMAA